MNKIRKVLSFVLTLAMAFGMIPLWTGTVHATPAPDPTKWESHADIGWYVNDTDGIYTINSDTELAGLAVLVNAGESGTVKYNESGSQCTVTDSGIVTTTGSGFEGATIELGADIDLSEHEWVPIGNGYPFSGSFDGNNHTISGLKIGTALNPDDSDYAGLFGYAVTNDEDIGTTLKNLKISGAAIYSAGQYVGAVAGDLYAEEVTNCTATGTIAYSHLNGGYVGGFAGKVNGNPSEEADAYNIENCHADCNVVSSGTGISTGGFAGAGYYLKNCYAEGDIVGGTRGYTGGLVGYGKDLEECHATGDVTGGESTSTDSDRTGGLVGRGGYSITNCYATGNVTCGAVASGQNGYAGGLIGYFNGGGDIINCHASGTINCVDNDAANSTANAGGLIGGTYYSGGGNIINSYSTGDVNGGKYDSVGGLAGECGKSVLNCFATGDIEAGDDSYVGGFVGYADSNSYSPDIEDAVYIENCYSAGSTTGGSNAKVGGFAGHLGAYYGCMIALNDYWNGDAIQIASGSAVSPKVGFSETNTYLTLVTGTAIVSEAAMQGAAVAAGEIPYYTSYDVDAADNTPVTTATSFIEALNGGRALLDSSYDYMTWFADSIGSNGSFPILAEPPQLSNPTCSGISASGATVGFTSDKAGTYYYLAYLSSQAAPNAAALLAGTSGSANDGSNSFTVSGLSASTAYSVYMIEKDALNIVSNIVYTSFMTAAQSTGGNGGGGGGGSTPASGATNAITTKTDPSTGITTTTLDVDATTNSNGATAATLTAEQLSSAIEDATGEAQNQNTRSNVQIDINAGDNASSISVTIPQTSFEDLTDNHIDTLTIDSPLGTVTLDSTALGAINGSASGDVTITVEKVAVSALSEAEQAEVGNRPIYDLTVMSGSTAISSFNGGIATVGIPYTLAAGEDPTQIVIYYLNDSGDLVAMPSVYDEETGTVSFTTKHLSTYVVGYNEVSFSDVSGWYADYVNYLAARGIINGTSDTTFSPNKNITRAQFAAILANLAGADVGRYTESAFSDVKTTAWYFGAAQWAYENGVAAGADGKFNPNAGISRQDMAVMIARYAEKVADYTLPETNGKVTFTDADSISSYASDAVTAMQQAGVISGKSNKLFAPKASATRAESAKMIAVFLQGTVK